MQKIYLHIGSALNQKADATMIMRDEETGLRIKTSIHLDFSYQDQSHAQIGEYIPGRGFVALLDMGGQEGTAEAWHSLPDLRKGRLLSTPDKFHEWMLAQLCIMDALGRSIAEAPKS